MAKLGRCVFCEHKTEGQEAGQFCCDWHRAVLRRVHAELLERHQTYRKDSEQRILTLENDLEALQKKYAAALRQLRGYCNGKLEEEWYMQKDGVRPDASD